MNLVTSSVAGLLGVGMLLGGLEAVGLRAESTASLQLAVALTYFFVIVYWLRYRRILWSAEPAERSVASGVFGGVAALGATTLLSLDVVAGLLGFGLGLFGFTMGIVVTDRSTASDPNRAG